MARLLFLLGGILLSFSPPAEAAAQYSIIPEPSRTELKQETATTLQLLSDREAPSLRTDAYRLTVTPQGAHLASGGKEGRIYGLATLRQLRDQLAEQPEGIQYILLPLPGYLRSAVLDLPAGFREAICRPVPVPYPGGVDPESDPVFKGKCCGV